MKTLLLFIGIALLNGCTLGASREVKHAEKMLSYFQCKKIESTEMTHSAITNFYEGSLAASHRKAESYVQSYKDGEELFDLPLTEVIEQQYLIYKAACQNLGGIGATTPE